MKQVMAMNETANLVSSQVASWGVSPSTLQYMWKNPVFWMAIIAAWKTILGLSSGRERTDMMTATLGCVVFVRASRVSSGVSARRGAVRVSLRRERGGEKGEHAIAFTSLSLSQSIITTTSLSLCASWPKKALKKVSRLSSRSSMLAALIKREALGREQKVKVASSFRFRFVLLPRHRKLPPTPRTRTLSPGEGTLLYPFRRVKLNSPLPSRTPPYPCPLGSVGEGTVRPTFVFSWTETHRQEKCVDLSSFRSLHERLRGRGYTSREALDSAMACGEATPHV